MVILSKPLALFALPALLVTACSGQPVDNDAAAHAANAAATVHAPVTEGDDAVLAALTAAQSRPIGHFGAETRLNALMPGPHIYADFGPIAGHEAESTALVLTPQLAAFLKAHKDVAMTVSLDTVNMLLDPPGERMDATVLRGVAVGAASDDSYWQTLTDAQRNAATQDFDAMKKIDPSAG
jgi:hypothetical protein